MKAGVGVGADRWRARCEVRAPPSPPGAAEVGPLGLVVTSSAEELAVLVQTPRDLHDARRNSAECWALREGAAEPSVRPAAPLIG